MTEQYDVFISYSHADTQAMTHVRDHLRTLGMRIWTDEGIVPGTQNWQIAIEQALRNTRAVVVLLSPDSATSLWVREELGFAQNLGKKVYPLLIKGDETDAIPFGYSKAQWIDIRRGELVEPGIEKLYVALRKQNTPEVDLQSKPDNSKGLLPGRYSKRFTIPIFVVSTGVVALIVVATFPSLFKLNNKDMTFIESGSFYMGNDEGAADQRPARNVYLDSFWIDTFEVTNAEYKVFVEETNHRPPDHWSNGEYSPGQEDHPVIGVTWTDAKQFCEWNGAKRLPKEAEWEKAARGIDRRKWPWGNSWTDGFANTFEAKINFTSPGGNFPEDKSPYGVMDMAGNAQEWVNDWYLEDYYSKATSQNPPGPNSGTYRVVRGGAPWLGKDQATTYYRLGIYPPDFPYPATERITSPTAIIGFRCACDNCN
jgi:formylglycine-generating enzyme required for sulfatase activity